MSGGARRGDASAPPVRRALGARLAAAAALIGAVAVVAYRAVGERQRARALERRVGALVTAQHDLERRLDSTRDSLAAREALLAGITGADVRVIDVRAPGARAPSARVFWDASSGTWTLVAHGLPPLPAGHVYQVWLVTRGRGTVSAATFTARAGGGAVVVAHHPLAADALAAITITAEPVGGSPRPTSSPVLVGAAGGR